MAEKGDLLNVFEATFEQLYKYVYRRLDQEDLVKDVLHQVYLKVDELNEIDDEKVLLVCYQFAYSVLKNRGLLLLKDDFWKNLDVEEAEVLKLRFFEELSTFDIAFVMQEQAGRLDAFLYATLMKAQDLFPDLAERKYIGAYFADLNSYFKRLKDEEVIVVPDELKVELAQELFNQTYNGDREFKLLEVEKSVEELKIESPFGGYVGASKERPEVKDFFNSPMQDTEKEQFNIPEPVSQKSEEDDMPDFIKEALAKNTEDSEKKVEPVEPLVEEFGIEPEKTEDTPTESSAYEVEAQSEEVLERHPEWELKEEEKWVPEDKGSDLPKENPEGYGMDLLKTFSKPAEEEERLVEPKLVAEMESIPVKLQVAGESAQEFVQDPVQEKLVNVEEEKVFPDPISVLERSKEPVRESINHAVSEPKPWAEDGASPEQTVVDYSEVDYAIPEETEARFDFDEEELTTAEKIRSWRRSLASPLIALLIVILGTIYFPFGSDVDKFSEEYKVTYSDDLTFDQRKDLVDNVLKDLVVDREIRDIYVVRLTEKNVQVTFRLEGEMKEGEFFVFYKMNDGRWAPRKYQAVVN